MTIDMRKYYVCRHCGEINYDTAAYQKTPWSLICYPCCEKCGKTTPWYPAREGIEFTKEEIENSIEYINNKVKKAKKIKGEEVNWSDLPEKKKNVIRKLDVIGTLLNELLYGRFRVETEENIIELIKQKY